MPLDQQNTFQMVKEAEEAVKTLIGWARDNQDRDRLLGATPCRKND